MNGNWKHIETQLEKNSGKRVHFSKIESVSGGCINDSYKVTDDSNKTWFIKTNKKSKLDMFISESKGLDAIKDTHCIRVPSHICSGETAENSYLVLEHIDLKPTINQTLTGHAIAKMHLFKSDLQPNENPLKFGWEHDNTIGSTPQSNQFHAAWVTFFKEERLLYQLKLANSRGYPSSSYNSGLKLADNLSQFFTSYTPQASLLHGDLWSGNCASDNEGNPVIFDPAVYRGDRETDIAMTELFGGFSQKFYDAYNEVYPLDQGYKTRKQLYNLYHVLNHFNIFGGSYASQAADATHSLLAEL